MPSRFTVHDNSLIDMLKIECNDIIMAFAKKKRNYVVRDRLECRLFLFFCREILLNERINRIQNILKY